MAKIIEVTDLSLPELDVFARLTEAQLRNKLEPEKGVFVAESPKVIARALDAGCRPHDRGAELVRIQPGEHRFPDFPVPSVQPFGILREHILEFYPPRIPIRQLDHNIGRNLNRIIRHRRERRIRIHAEIPRNLVFLQTAGNIHHEPPDQRGFFFRRFFMIPTRFGKPPARFEKTFFRDRFDINFGRWLPEPFPKQSSSPSPNPTPPNKALFRFLIHTPHITLPCTPFILCYYNTKTEKCKYIHHKICGILYILWHEESVGCERRPGT